MHGTPKYTEKSAHLEYANPDAPEGGRFIYSALGTFDTVNPFSIKGKAAEGLDYIYDRLSIRTWDEPFTLYPLIAERFDIAQDRSSLTVHINPKARFHDGSPITAEDVLYSFDTLKNEGRPNMRRVYRLVKHAAKTDSMTVHFDFGDGYDQETPLILAMMPVLSKAYWKDRTFDSTTLDAPLSNGPYRIKTIDPGRKIVYERVPDYWAKDHFARIGHNNFDEIVYDYFRDDMVAFEAFKAGEVDFRREYNIGRWSSGYDFPALTEGRVKKEAIPHSRPERLRSLIFNTRRTPFDNIKVREALDLALDFDWINQNIFYGQYKRITSFYPNSELAATGLPSEKELALLKPWEESLPDTVFGPAQTQTDAIKDKRTALRKANALLNEAGYPVQDGKRFSFEILINAPEDEKIVLSYKQALERLGITVSIRVLDTASFRDRLNDYDYDMVLYHWISSLSPGTEQMLYWSCEAANQPARWNYPGICSKAVDSIASGIAQAKTREDLVTHVHALDRILFHSHYVIPLYYAGKDFVAYNTAFQRPENTPIYGTILETWWMTPNQAK